MNRMMNCVVLAIALQLCACGAADEPELAAEPELTAEELAILPDGLADHEHDHAMLVEGVAEDDAAIFDDDGAELRFDEEVVDDDDGASVTGTIAFQPLLRSGLHPRASDGLRAAGVAAWRITQTIGTAPASAGVHKQDGTVNGRPYTAAVDLSTSGLSTTQIHNLLERLAKVGFAAWYRRSGSDGWSGSNHIHAVYANSKMKTQLRSQVRSWLLGRNGLVSNTTYKFHAFSATARSIVKAKFAQSGSGTERRRRRLGARQHRGLGAHDPRRREHDGRGDRLGR